MSPANILFEGALLSLLLFTVALTPLLWLYFTDTQDTRHMPLSFIALAAGLYVASASGLGMVLIGSSIAWQYLSLVAVCSLPAGICTFIIRSFTQGLPCLYLHYYEKGSRLFAAAAIIGVTANIVSTALIMKVLTILALLLFSFLVKLLLHSVRTGNGRGDIVLIGLISACAAGAVSSCGPVVAAALPLAFPLVWGLLLLFISFLLTLKPQPAAVEKPVTVVDQPLPDETGSRTAVSAFAHEVNTPLGTGLLTASHLEEEVNELYRLYRNDELKKSDLDRHLSSYKEAVEIITTSLQNASELVRILKHDTANTALKQEHYSVNDCLTKVIGSLKPRISQAGHHIRYSCQDRLALNGHPVMLAQIVTNLIMNSLTHAYAAGAQGCLTLEVTAAANILTIKYTDDGKGIDSRIRNRIFEPYYTTKPDAGNNGLGLFIIHSLVTYRLGGTIDCQSQPGQGTEFTIKLPIERS